MAWVRYQGFSFFFFFPFSFTAFVLPGIGHKYSAFYGPNTKGRAISAEKFAVLLPRFKEVGGGSSVKSSGNHNGSNLLPAVFAGLTNSMRRC